MAFNVTLSSIYLGNFADIDTDESNQTTESEASLLGSYGGPGNPLSSSITPIVTDSSDNLLLEDSSSTADDWTYDVGAGTQVTDLDSVVFFNGTITYTDGTTETNGFFNVVQMVNGDVFVMIPDGDAALSAKPIESIDIVSVQSDDYGGLQQSQYDDTTFVCFAPGALIKTPHGDTFVQDLRAGHLVETLDQGAQPIAWAGARTLTFPDAPDSQKPYSFKAGCLGTGLPLADLVVSPQHQILCITPDGEQFTLAKSLEQLQGVRQMRGKRSVTYHTLLFRRHEVIFANGLAVESLFPGERSMRLLSPVQRLQVIAQVPGILDGGFGTQARPTLKCQDAIRLLDLGALEFSRYLRASAA